MNGSSTEKSKTGGIQAQSADVLPKQKFSAHSPSNETATPSPSKSSHTLNKSNNTSLTPEKKSPNMKSTSPSPTKNGAKSSVKKKSGVLPPMRFVTLDEPRSSSPKARSSSKGDSPDKSEHSPPKKAAIHNESMHESFDHSFLLNTSSITLVPIANSYRIKSASRPNYRRAHTRKRRC